MFQALTQARRPKGKCRYFARACPWPVSGGPPQPGEVEAIGAIMAGRQQQPMAMGAAHIRFDRLGTPAGLTRQKRIHLILGFSFH